MVKGKVAKKALSKLSQTKVARGAGIASGARAAEEVVSNPYAQAGLGAVEGAALGATLGPAGAVGVISQAGFSDSCLQMVKELYLLI